SGVVSSTSPSRRRVITRMRGCSGRSMFAIAMSNGVDGFRSEIAVFTLKRPIGLLLDDPRSGRKIDRLLEPRALVVEPVNHAREFDKRLAKVRPRLAIADGILYVPELGIHPFEFGAELIEHGALYFPQLDRAQRLELAQDVLKLARVLDALGLYF